VQVLEPAESLGGHLARWEEDNEIAVPSALGAPLDDQRRTSGRLQTCGSRNAADTHTYDECPPYAHRAHTKTTDRVDQECISVIVDGYHRGLRRSSAGTKWTRSAAPRSGSYAAFRLNGMLISSRLVMPHAPLGELVMSSPSQVPEGVGTRCPVNGSPA
jgi:hypothetical protein